MSKISQFEDPWGNSGKHHNKPASSNKDFARIINIIEEKFSNFSSGGGKFNKKLISIVALGIFGIWLLTGFYTINPEEEGVELIFGKYNQTSMPGLRYNFPYPIGSVTKVKSAVINKEEIGYSSTYKGEGEGVMLTGDENIVNVNFEVQWRIKNPYNFLYKVHDFDFGQTVKSAAESAMRDEVAQSKISFVLRGEGRAKIALETKNLLQQILDSYDIGVEVISIQMKKVDPPEKVISAFRDVQSARADKEKEINQAYMYQNDIIPRSHGEATRVLKDAEAYKITAVNQAKGEAKRFEEIHNQYKKSNKKIMMERMYLEVMEDIYKNSEKMVLSNNTALPLLDLNKK